MNSQISKVSLLKDKAKQIDKLELVEENDTFIARNEDTIVTRNTVANIDYFKN